MFSEDATPARVDAQAKLLEHHTRRRRRFRRLSNLAECTGAASLGVIGSMALDRSDRLTLGLAIGAFVAFLLGSIWGSL